MSCNVIPITATITIITSLVYTIAFYYEIVWLSHPETDKMIIIPHIVITHLSVLVSYLMTLAATYLPTYKYDLDQVNKNDLQDTPKPCLVIVNGVIISILNFILCDIMIFGAAMAFAATTPLGGDHSYQQYNTIMTILLVISVVVFYNYYRSR